MERLTFGLIITSRSFFPAHLALEERNKILAQIEAAGHQSVVLSEEDTPMGAVASMADAKKCAALFRKHGANLHGIIVVLANFGEETPVAESIRGSGLDIPVLVVGCDDKPDSMGLDKRRDAFCGKLSVCNNLYQRNIKFSLTKTHTVEIASPAFAMDLARFASVCRVVHGLRHLTVGAVGARPQAFQTVRFSEKLLEASGISTITVDLSEIIALAQALPDGEALNAKLEEINAYGQAAECANEEKMRKLAKLCMALEGWLEENGCQASAVQCWSSIQHNYGCATCLAMSMMGEKGKPSACEMDVTGAVTMYALSLASGVPAGYLDWNNNYGEDRDLCVNLHCSNFPKSFFGNTDIEIGNLDVLATTIGAERCFGACKGRVQEGPMTFAKITTDDKNGRIKFYVGQGEFLNHEIQTKGGVALCRVNGLQNVMSQICKDGFEHHVCICRGEVADIVREALEGYLGWECSFEHV